MVDNEVSGIRKQLTLKNKKNHCILFYTFEKIDSIDSDFTMTNFTKRKNVQTAKKNYMFPNLIFNAF